MPNVVNDEAGVLFQCDQPKQGAVSNAQKMDEYVKENGFAGWFETSAKENVNIEEAARALVNKVGCRLCKNSQSKIVA